MLNYKCMDIFHVILYVIAFLYSVILHEISHGLMAQSLGDQTARQAGRLTLNPIKHLDLFGSVLLPLATFLAGGFIFGYAKPVPYDPLNLSDKKYGPAKVALAGPLSNIILALLFGMALRFLPNIAANPELANLLGDIVYINIVLAVFNLVPIPPLDGHWILFTFLPARFAELKYNITRYSMFLFVIFVFFLFPMLNPLIKFLFHAIVAN